MKIIIYVRNWMLAIECFFIFVKSKKKCNGNVKWGLNTMKCRCTRISAFTIKEPLIIQGNSFRTVKLPRENVLSSEKTISFWIINDEKQFVSCFTKVKKQSITIIIPRKSYFGNNLPFFYLLTLSLIHQYLFSNNFKARKIKI